jgi:hypothetical protein
MNITGPNLSKNYWVFTAPQGQYHISAIQMQVKYDSMSLNIL